MIRFRLSNLSLFLATLVAAGLGYATDARSITPSAEASAPAESIQPYLARFGRDRPVIAVVGENSGTELTDFVIPYGVLSRSGAAEVWSVATRPGILKLRPAVQVQPQATTAQFDELHPDGADYVLVPAVDKSDDAVLLAWITAQSEKGATIVSICDGALVVAKAGLMRGHRATGHWATQAFREETYPDTLWETNTRYVADGRVVSSAGISASIPVSLALVEAIAGHDRAAALAQEMGVSDWSPRHDSDAFHFGTRSLAMYGAAIVGGWFHRAETVGLVVLPGVDEIALALTADVYSRTYRGVRALTVASSAEPVRSLGGLLLVPDRLFGGNGEPDRMLSPWGGAPSMHALDEALNRVSEEYGRAASASAAYDLEYARAR
jgi:transcriptional regulator GlxA family with amidase domain